MNTESIITLSFTKMALEKVISSLDIESPLEKLVSSARKHNFHHDLKDLLEDFDIDSLILQPPDFSDVESSDGSWIRTWIRLFRGKQYEVVSSLGTDGESLSLFHEGVLIFTF